MQYRIIQDVIIATLRGRIDIHTNSGISDELQDLLQSHENMHLVLDLTAVEYVSSSGLGLLVSLNKKLSENGKTLKLAGMNPAVEKIFRAVGMLDHFACYPEVNAALDSL